MKKKIGIITLPGYFNYGNRLQNYAMLQILLKFDLDVYSLLVQGTVSDRIKRTVYKKGIKNIFKQSPYVTYKKVANKFFGKNKTDNIKVSQSEKNRTKIFKKFSDKYLNELSINYDQDHNLIDSFSFFITGSDQVWNPIYYSDMDKYFITFADSKKRLSYSPSISVDKIPEEYRNDYAYWLNNMSAVSIREEAGAKIIKDLTGIDAPVLVDPTMLLNKDEWLTIASRANNRPEEPYLLTYFLGGPTDTTRKKLEKIAVEQNMTIINLGDSNEKETYETGPSEFLDYINNASAFFTDSFHGVVFSIIFQTPFIVYERISSTPSMYSRIETILDMFNMRNREEKEFTGSIFSMDFSNTEEVLNREYEKSIHYLRDALRNEE